MIGAPGVDGFTCLLEPAGADGDGGVEIRHVRFDIQQRRTVEHIDVLDFEGAVMDSVELNDGEVDGVGAFWGAGGEESACFGSAA